MKRTYFARQAAFLARLAAGWCGDALSEGQNDEMSVDSIDRFISEVRDRLSFIKADVTWPEEKKR